MLKESQKNSEVRQVLKDLLTSKNNDDGLIEDLMGASKNNSKAAMLLDDIPSKGLKRYDIETPAISEEVNITEPNKLIEENFER